MNTRIFVIFLILASLIVAGCVTDEENGGVDENISGDNQTDANGEDNATTDMDDESGVVDNETTDMDNETPVVDETDTETEEDSGVSVVESTGPRTYTVTLKNFLAQPSNLTINQEDSVFWINMNQPTRTFTLVSEEGLWENKPLTYRSSFTYKFNETGTYNYHILGWEERMKGTITVK